MLHFFFKTLRQQHGMSLLEVLLSIGMVGVVAAGAMQVLPYYVGSEVAKEMAGRRADVRALLREKIDCAATFSTPVTCNGSLIELKSASGTLLNASESNVMANVQLKATCTGANEIHVQYRMLKNGIASDDDVAPDPLKVGAANAKSTLWKELFDSGPIACGKDDCNSPGAHCIFIASGVPRVLPPSHPNCGRVEYGLDPSVEIGREGHSAHCKTLAELPASIVKGKNWKALLSLSPAFPLTAADALTMPAQAGAAAYLNISGPVYTTSGKKIADNAADLWDGTVDDTIDSDHTGAGSGAYAVTGSDSSGNYSSSCWAAAPAVGMGVGQYKGCNCMNYNYGQNAGNMYHASYGRPDRTNAGWAFNAHSGATDGTYCTWNYAAPCPGGGMVFSGSNYNTPSFYCVSVP